MTAQNQILTLRIGIIGLFVAIFLLCYQFDKKTTQLDNIETWSVRFKQLLNGDVFIAESIVFPAGDQREIPPWCYGDSCNGAISFDFTTNICRCFLQGSTGISFGNQ